VNEYHGAHPWKECDDRSPDGLYRCAFGADHKCPYHSHYPHAWRNGAFIDPYTSDGLKAAGLVFIGDDLEVWEPKEGA